MLTFSASLMKTWDFKLKFKPAGHLPLGAERPRRRPELPSLPVRPARSLGREPRSVLPRRLPGGRGVAGLCRRRSPFLFLLVSED